MQASIITVKVMVPPWLPPKPSTSAPKTAVWPSMIAARSAFSHSIHSGIIAAPWKALTMKISSAM
jgi:hypothetical protein